MRTTGAATVNDAALRHLDDHVCRRVERGELPFAANLIWRGGELVHETSFGFRDVERQQPYERNTIVRLFSMSKPIASIALMQLFERGHFVLDAPASDFIPAWKDLAVRTTGTGFGPMTEPCLRPITVRDLLTHQAGLPPAPVRAEAAANPLRSMGRVGTLAETAAALGGLPLDFQPGALFSYGVSTDMVGHLVELISGQRFDHYLQQHILDPLGMRDTGFSVAPAAADRLASLYQMAGGGIVLVDDPADSPMLDEATYFSGAGGMLGTIGDYLRFARMLLNGGTLDGERIIGRKTLELMTLNHLTGGRTIGEATVHPFFDDALFQGMGFGLGFAVMLDPARAQTSGTPGEYHWSGAAGTHFFVDRAEDMVWIYLTQALPDTTRGWTNPYGWRELRTLVYAAID